MPGFYANGEYDLAGFCVGSVSKDRLINGSGIREGDKLIGLQSSGIHSNRLFAGTQSDQHGKKRIVAVYRDAGEDSW